MLSCCWILAHKMGTLSDLPATGICFSFFDPYLRLGVVGSVWFTPCKDLCVAGLFSIMSFLHGLWSEASIILYDFPFKVQFLLTYLFHFLPWTLGYTEFKIVFLIIFLLTASLCYLAQSCWGIFVYTLANSLFCYFFFFNQCGTYFNM